MRRWIDEHAVTFWLIVLSTIIIVGGAINTKRITDEEAALKRESRARTTAIAAEDRKRLEDLRDSIDRNTATLNEVCAASKRSWEANDRVARAAANPPSRVGAPLTPAQREAVMQYAASLRQANGPRPTCKS